VLRTRALHGSPEVLNELLEHEGCDVDYTNHLEGATPLHLAVKIEHPGLRAYIVDSLLDAGANTRFGFTLSWTLLPSILTVLPVVSKTRRVMCPWTMYLKKTQKRETHSAAIRFKVASLGMTLLMVRVPWLFGACQD
jgi:ankyrin repeat protein